jgi:hypothetical protein
VAEAAKVLHFIFSVFLNAAAGGDVANIPCSQSDWTTADQPRLLVCMNPCMLLQPTHSLQSKQNPSATAAHPPTHPLTSKAVASCPGFSSAPRRSRLASTSIGLSSGTPPTAAAAAAPAAVAAADWPCCFASRAAAPRCRMAARVGPAAVVRLGRQVLWQARASMTSCASGAIKGSEVCCSHTCAAVQGHTHTQGHTQQGALISWAASVGTT